MKKLILSFYLAVNAAAIIFLISISFNIILKILSIFGIILFMLNIAAEMTEVKE